MDVLRQWKSQGGKGTYIPDDNTDSLKVVNYLISTVGKLNDNIVCYGTKANVDKYTEALGRTVFSHDVGILPAEPMFLLIILDVDLVPKDILTFILVANPHKYLFCTATDVTRLGNGHKQVAPIIDVKIQRSTERNITAISRIDYNLAIDLNTDDQMLYDGYTIRMNEIFTFFDGDYDMINACYRGDPKTGKTADIFRREFATKNHWSDDMDTSIEYYKEVDKHYNPNSIYEKSKLYCELLADRNHFTDEHKDKVYVTNKLIEYYNTKRFLIVCRNSHMADYVHDMLKQRNSCKSNAIHTDLESVNFADKDNEMILYKSGARKGQMREFGATSQTNTYVNWFNSKITNVLICTSAVQKGLVLKDLDIVVYLSPRCISLTDLQKRIKISFTGNIHIVNVYLDGTKDKSLLSDNQKGFKHSIKNYYKGDIGKLLFQ